MSIVKHVVKRNFAEIRTCRAATETFFLSNELSDSNKNIFFFLNDESVGPYFNVISLQCDLSWESNNGFVQCDLSFERNNGYLWVICHHFFLI